jgi:2',3'-cyclic-nucleotide 2'-phosphodiesterase (5'-nucleotidase family)
MHKTKGMMVVLALLGVGLAGCWDDEESSSDPGVDAGTDVVAETSLPETGTDTMPDKQDTGPDVTEDVEPDVEPDTKPDVELPPPSGTIQVLTINDFHGQLDKVTSTDSATGITTHLGGVAYAASYFQKERDENPNTIILNGGDEVGASPTLSAYGTDIRDEPAILSLNYLGVTASNIGNHSFDDGTAHLKDLLEIASFDYLGANVEDPSDDLGGLFIKPYKMYEYGDPDNPIKVAIVGISNPETAQIVLAGNMGNVTISEPVGAANDAVALARADGAHIVLVTSHIGATGVSTDGSGAPIGPLVDFANNLQNVDLVQGGHTEAVVGWKLGDKMIVQSDGQLMAYNKVEITVTDGVVTDMKVVEVPVIGKQTVAPESGSCENNDAVCPADFACNGNLCQKDFVEEDPGVVALMEPWKTHLAAKFDEKITTIDGIWIRDGKIERSEEVPMGDLVADAILSAYAGLGAQIAFMNGGGIRDSLPSAYVPKDTSLVRTGCSPTTPCDVTLGDIYTVLPFNNTVVLRDVPGSLVWEIMEHSVSALPSFHGRFQQVAGIRIEYKYSADPGARLISIEYYGDGTITPVPITDDDDTIYRIAINDFMNGGGDGFTMLIEEEVTVPWGLFNDAVAHYVKGISLLETPTTYDRIIMIP